MCVLLCNDWLLMLRSFVSYLIMHVHCLCWGGEREREREREGEREREDQHYSKLDQRQTAPLLTNPVITCDLCPCMLRMH